MEGAKGPVGAKFDMPTYRVDAVVSAPAKTPRPDLELQMVRVTTDGLPRVRLGIRAVPGPYKLVRRRTLSVLPLCLDRSTRGRAARPAPSCRIVPRCGSGRLRCLGGSGPHEQSVNDVPRRVGSASSRLIVIRGNSGSGKSVVAAGVRAGRPYGTLAVVGQDVIRRTILGTHDDQRLAAVGLIDLTARYALDRGFDVIVEGILNAKWYGRAFDALAQDHVGVTQSYIYDLPFDETVRRHSTKEVADRFGEAEMRDWWYGLQPIASLREARITEHETLDETVQRILDDCWGS